MDEENEQLMGQGNRGDYDSKSRNELIEERLETNTASDQVPDNDTTTGDMRPTRPPKSMPTQH